MQLNKVNVNEMDYVKWNKWDGLWTEGNKNEIWTIKCALKEMRWYYHNCVWQWISCLLELNGDGF